MLTLLAAAALGTGTLAVSEATLQSHMKVIAGIEHAGRMTLSHGQELSAEYIAKQFKKFGLSEGPNPGYFHSFDITVNQRPAKNNMLAISGGGKSLAFELGKDYVPLTGSDPVRLVTAPIVYVGYGLGDDDWNDYNGIDVTGKIVLALRGVPQGRESRSNGAKARVAQEKGAVGFIVAGSTGPGRSELPPYTRQQGIATTLGIVAVAIHGSRFKEVTGMDLAEARAAKGPASKAINMAAKIVTELEPNVGKARNVIGYLPGNDPALRDEFIIVGAHFDHLGWGEAGSRTGVDAIHFGADDNGSGTVGLLGLAEYFARTRSNRRTIIFQAYSAEELGLVGSRNWANDPAHADTLAKTTAMVNMDMIGTVRFDTCFAFGTSSSAGWPDVLRPVKVDGLKLDGQPHVRGDSDQATFARKSLPVLFFHTGLTADYHTETDGYDRINFKGMALVCEAVKQTVEGIDRLDKKLEFNPQVVLGNKPTDRRLPGPNGWAIPPPSAR